MHKDGSFVQKIENKLALGCRYRRWFGSININSSEAKNNCMFKACVDAQFTPFEDIFIKYPGIFDHIATVDKVIEIGYKYRNKNDRYTHYRLTGRNQVTAMVNLLGIVDHFVVNYRAETYKIFYSKRYNELFMSDGATYITLTEYYMPKSTIEYIKRKIAKIYE
jgi:hypothetical protein